MPVTKALIIGSEGFIGKHLVAFLLSRGCEVYGCDLFEVPSQHYNYLKISRLSPDWDELVSQQSFDTCINAAGSGNVPYSMTHPVSDFESNTLDVIRILDSLRRSHSYCRYMHISSAAVYGNPQKLPVEEKDPTRPLSPYGWHKLMSEQLCMEYSQLFNIRTAVVRPFSVYGPGLKKQLFWDLYQKYLVHKGKIELFGTGEESRDFIYITDLVLFFERILQHAPMNGEVYNAASGMETTIREVANLFLSMFENAPQLVFNQKTREGDPLNWRADMSKATGLGFTPKTSLETGLSDVAFWMKKMSQTQQSSL